MSDGRGDLSTERVNPRSAGLDRMTTEEAVACFLDEDATVVEAVRRASTDIARAVDLVAARLARGGRLFYVGAGTSGRLGVLDSVECPPTFQSDPGRVRALIAGGSPALRGAVEGAEDDRSGAHAELREAGLAENDCVLGITAGGTTPYVHGALELAAECGAGTVFFACVGADAVPDAADVSIRVVTGPEVLSGSTRLKAGTATKLVLNMVSTLVMTKLGKVHDNLMVDVNTRANAKLVERGVRLVERIAGVLPAEARTLLERAEGQVKHACVMHAHGCDLAGARARLERVGGLLRRALED